MLDKLRDRAIAVPYTTYKQVTTININFLKNVGNAVFVGNNYTNTRDAYIFKVGVWMDCTKDFMGKKFPLTEKKCWKSDVYYPCGFHSFGSARDLSLYVTISNEYLENHHVYEVKVDKILATGTEKYGQTITGVIVSKQIKLTRRLSVEELKRLARRR